MALNKKILFLSIFVLSVGAVLLIALTYFFQKELPKQSVADKPRVIAIEPVPIGSIVSVPPSGEITFSFSRPIDSKTLTVTSVPFIKLNTKLDDGSTKLTVWPAISWDVDNNQQISILGGGLSEPTIITVDAFIDTGF